MNVRFPSFFDSLLFNTLRARPLNQEPLGFLFVSTLAATMAGIHISSRQVLRDDYKMLRTSIKNHKLVRWTSKF